MKKIFGAIITLAVVCGIFFVLQRVFMPKYVSEILEGGMIAEYYDEHEDHDLLFIGDCEVYENFSPITLWENYGITSYIRGSAQQLIWQSYYLLEEALKYEKPKAVIFNVLSMKYDVPQSEAYNRMSIDGMKLSKSKLDNVKASMMEDETSISYLLPLLRYHSRWNELKKEDFEYAFKEKNKVTVSGYLMHCEVNPVKTIPDPKRLTDYTFGENSYKYLDMITKICKDNDIELILIKAPTLNPPWYDEWESQIEEYAAKNGLRYYNFLENQEEIGIDWNTDTYDRGLHLNVYGAEKLSDYFGNILSKELSLPDHSGDSNIQKIWADKVKAYDDMKAAQEAEYKQYGYLPSWGGHPVGDK
ncbi:MAG: SGNH/GDSL hydrolase family protein [Lachnospiraceae bacterium]|nr:SGNH/GDSL hydrolase family protein [Lachnospiraceae bacterium]